MSSNSGQNFASATRFVVERSIDERSEVLDDLPAVATRATTSAQQGIRKVPLKRHARIKRESCSDDKNRSFTFR